MDTTRKAGAARGRFLVAMRPEPAAAADTRDVANLLGLRPELMHDVLGSALPRIIGSRSTLEEAEALARVLTARGRESIAWDREQPLTPLFQADRLLMEGAQFILEQQRDRRRLILPARDIHRIVDLRLRTDGASGAANRAGLSSRTNAAPGKGQQFPDRALLFVPEPGRGEPGVLMTRTLSTGDPPLTGLAANQLLQEVANKARALVRERVMEVRTTASALGLEEADGDPLDRALQLLARLPPTPATALGM